MRPQVLVFHVHQAAGPAERFGDAPGYAAFPLGREGQGARPRGIGAQDLHGLAPAAARGGPVGPGRGRQTELARSRTSRSRWIGLYDRGRGVVPPFPEHGFHVCHRRAAQLNLDVVPGRARPVHRSHRLRLAVPASAASIASAVAEVDPADEGAVQMRPARMAQHHELLVVRAAGPHPHVEQALPTGGVDLLAEVAVLPLGELEAIQVRPPDQAPDNHAPFGRPAQDRTDLGAVTVEALVGIAAPVRKSSTSPDRIASNGGHKGREVLGAVDERPHLVARCPGPRRRQWRRSSSVASLPRSDARRNQSSASHQLCLPNSPDDPSHFATCPCHPSGATPFGRPGRWGISSVD